MAVITFHDAAGVGASMGDPHFSFVPNEGRVSVDGDPIVRPYDYNTSAFTFSYNGGAFYATAYISEMRHPYYLLESIYYSDGAVRPILSMYGINLRFNLYDDFSRGMTITNMLRWNDTLNGNRYSDTLRSGDGADIVQGNGGNDFLDAGRGNDAVYGGSGNDILIGGAGADRLSGGTGADRFRYNTRSDRGDTITDFVARSDRLEFKSTQFGYLPRGALAASRFQSLANSNRATSRNVRFVFNRQDRSLYFDADGSGGQAAVKIVTLSNRTSLSASDIFIV